MKKFNIKLRRGLEVNLNIHNPLLLENEIICTIPDDVDEVTKNSIDYLKQPIFKYKLGDGIHCWKELEYQEGTIPIAITCSFKNHYREEDDKANE